MVLTHFDSPSVACEMRLRFYYFFRSTEFYFVKFFWLLFEIMIAELLVSLNVFSSYCLETKGFFFRWRRWERAWKFSLWRFFFVRHVIERVSLFIVKDRRRLRNLKLGGWLGRFVWQKQRFVTVCFRVFSMWFLSWSWGNLGLVVEVFFIIVDRYFKETWKTWGSLKVLWKN